MLYILAKITKLSVEHKRKFANIFSRFQIVPPQKNTYEVFDEKNLGCSTLITFRLQCITNPSQRGKFGKAYHTHVILHPLHKAKTSANKAALVTNAKKEASTSLCSQQIFVQAGFLFQIKFSSNIGRVPNC